MISIARSEGIFNGKRENISEPLKRPETITYLIRVNSNARIYCSCFYTLFLTVR